MGDSEPVRAAVKELSFDVDYWVWVGFIEKRLNSIISRPRCLNAAHKGDPDALAQWSDWLLHIADLRARGDL